MDVRMGTTVPPMSVTPQIALNWHSALTLWCRPNQVTFVSPFVPLSFPRWWRVKCWDWFYVFRTTRSWTDTQTHTYSSTKPSSRSRVSSEAAISDFALYTSLQPESISVCLIMLRVRKTLLLANLELKTCYVNFLTFTDICSPTINYSWL